MGVSSTSLPPEFERALERITKYFNTTITPPINEKLIPDKIWKQSGFAVVVSSVPKIRTIPSGEGWRWNQAKHRYTVNVENSNYSVELTKLVPRKSVRSTLDTLPKLKVWKGTILMENNNQTVLWCEKGMDQTDIMNDIKEIDNLQIDDYSFLAPFMDSIESTSLFSPTDFSSLNWNTHSFYDEYIEFTG